MVFKAFAFKGQQTLAENKPCTQTRAAKIFSVFSRSLLHPYYVKNLDLDVRVIGVMEKGPSLWPSTQMEE